jgi:hypothetical protein
LVYFYKAFGECGVMQRSIVTFHSEKAGTVFVPQRHLQAECSALAQ